MVEWVDVRHVAFFSTLAAKKICLPNFQYKSFKYNIVKTNSLSLKQMCKKQLTN